MKNTLLYGFLGLALLSSAHPVEAMEQPEESTTPKDIFSLLPAELLEHIKGYLLAKSGTNLEDTLKEIGNYALTNKTFREHFSDPELLSKIIVDLQKKFPSYDLLSIALRIKSLPVAPALELLIDQGKVDVNKEFAKRTPIQRAVLKNRLDLLQILINKGATAGLNRSFEELYRNYFTSLPNQQEINKYLTEHGWTRTKWVRFIDKLEKKQPGKWKPSEKETLSGQLPLLHPKSLALETAAKRGDIEAQKKLEVIGEIIKLLGEQLAKPKTK